MTANTDSNIKGSVLLIHGSAPFDADGNVPDPRAGRYTASNFYKHLALELENRGWQVIRYAKPGVTNGKVDYKIYKTTDIACLSNQLHEQWDLLPKNKPRVVFAWSEGSLHVSALPLEQVDAVVILGGISTNIRDIVLWQAGDKKKDMENQLQEIAKFPREEMLGIDRPAGRLIDELNMPNNAKQLASRGHFPLLVLHGEADVEVPPSQTEEWHKYFEPKRVATLISRGRNHMFGEADKDGAQAIANEFTKWWTERPFER